MTNAETFDVEESVPEPCEVRTGECGTLEDTVDCVRGALEIMREPGLSDANATMYRWVLRVLEWCSERDGHWFSEASSFTTEIPEELRPQFRMRRKMQPGRVLITWARPELRNEQVTATCGEKECIRPSHSQGNRKPYAPGKPQRRGRSPRQTRNPTALAKNAANETQALLALTATIGHTDSVALVRSVQALARMGVDAAAILGTGAG